MWSPVVGTRSGGGSLSPLGCRSPSPASPWPPPASAAPGLFALLRAARGGGRLLALMAALRVRVLSLSRRLGSGRRAVGAAILLERLGELLQRQRFSVAGSALQRAAARRAAPPLGEAALSDQRLAHLLDAAPRHPQAAGKGHEQVVDELAHVGAVASVPPALQQRQVQQGRQQQVIRRRAALRGQRIEPVEQPPHELLLGPRRARQRPPRDWRRLLGAEVLAHLRQQHAEQARARQQLHTGACLSAAQHPQDLLAHARRRGTQDLLAVSYDRSPQLRIDLQPEAAGELHGAQPPHGVLLHAHVRVSDRAHDAPTDVLQALHVVDDLAPMHVVEEAIDGEVAPLSVLGGRAEDVVVGDEQVIAFVASVAASVGALAEGGHLDDLAPPKEDVREPEATTDHFGVAEQRSDVLRASRRGDVEVFGRDAQQEVPDAPPHEVGLMVVAPQASQHFDNVGVDEIPAEGVVDAYGFLQVGHLPAHHRRAEAIWQRPPAPAPPRVPAAPVALRAVLV